MVRQEGLQGIFRDYTDKVLGCFACSIGVQTMLFAELFAVIRALEIVKEKGWHKVWLERDSELVIKTFKDHFVVPWEGNICADRLTNFRASSTTTFFWWDSIPYFARAKYLIGNRITLP
ncbi:hypothetical protein GmHk_01G002719 [Glycine max]|nr:hypothetical protein GmHk_01G002719 [Glycine max]